MSQLRITETTMLVSDVPVVYHVKPDVPSAVSPVQLDVKSNTEFNDSLNGKHCVVTYDGRPFPGIIQDVDGNEHEVEVNVMHSVGDNRFFWPSAI